MASISSRNKNTNFKTSDSYFKGQVYNNFSTINISPKNNESEIVYFGFQNTNDIIGNVDLSTLTVDELKEKYDDVNNVLRSPYSYTNVNLFELELFLSKIEEEFDAREITLINADNIDVIINQLSTDIGTYNRSGNIRMVKQLEDEKKAYEALSDFISKNGKLYTSIEEAVKDFSLDVENECYTKSYDIFVPDNYDKDKLEGLYYLINKYPGLCDNPVIQLNATKYMCDKTASYISDEFKNKRKDLVLKCLKYNSDGSIDMENTDFVTLSFLRLENADILDCLEEIFGDGLQTDQICAGIEVRIQEQNSHWDTITRQQYEHYLELYNNNPSEGLAYFYSLKDAPKESANDYYYDRGSFEKTMLDYYFDYEFPEEEYANAVGMSQFLYQNLFAYENAINFELLNSDDFSEYVNDDLIIEISKDYKKYENIDDDSLNYNKIAYYMTEEERKVYFYRKNKYGDKNANEYLSFLKMELRDRAGKEKALETLKSFRVENKRERFDRIKDFYPEGFDPYEGEDIYDENGNPIYDFTGLEEQVLLALIGCEDGVATWWDGLENAFAADGEMSCFDYEKYYIIQMLNGNLEGYTVKNYEHFKTLTYEASLSMGNMLPTMAVSLAIQAGSGGLPLWALNALTTVSYANQGLFALSIYGNNKEQLLQSGLEHDAKLEFRAMLGALSEVALERYLGAIPGIGKLDDSANILCRMLKEGTEESTQVIVDALFDTIIYGEEFSVDMEELLKSGLLGSISGGVLNIPICVTINGVKTQFGSEVITDIYNVTDSDLIDMFYKSALSKSLAAYSVGNYTDAVNIMQELVNKNPNLYTNKVNEVCNNILNKHGVTTPEGDILKNTVTNNESIETLDENIQTGKSQPDIIKKDSNISPSEKNIQMGDKVTENGKNVSVAAGKAVGESALITKFNNLNTLISDISSNNVDINSLNLTKEKVNSYFEVDGVTIEQKYIMQKKFIDAVKSILLSGESINQTTFKAIFDSNIFSADSNFAKEYLYDALVDLGAPDLANEVRNIYEQARQSTINENTRENMSALYSFCDHTESHVLQVAFLTMSSLNAINNTISNNNNASGKFSQYFDYKTVFIAGLMHDLGMGAGIVNENGEFANPAINSYLKKVDGEIKLITEFIENNKDLAGTVRPNHTLNSALSILKNRSYFEQINVNPELLALLCFSHSKSNSGVSDLTSSSDWAFSIEKISEAVNLYNSKNPNNPIIFDIGVFGELTGQKVETSPQKVKKSNKQPYETNQIKFKDNLVEQLASLGLALRVGDAYVNKAKVYLSKDQTLKWSYNGKTYSTNMLVLTQTGAFMAYDANATYYNSKISNNVDTESSNYGAFIYFKMDENGNYVPWSADPNFKVEKKDGVFIIDDSNSSCLMSKFGELEHNFRLIDGREEKLLVLDNGYYKKIDGDNVKYYNVIEHKDGVYELEEIDETNSNYSSVISGNTISATSGQFLAGESNVSYSYFDDEGVLVSEYYVNDIEFFPFNTLDKGIVERVGEIATASGIKRAVDVIFDEKQFNEYFEVIDGCVVVKGKNGGIDYGKIFIDEIIRISGKSDNIDIKFSINGYDLVVNNGFNDSNEVKLFKENSTNENIEVLEMPKLKSNDVTENTNINNATNSLETSDKYFYNPGDLSIKESDSSSNKVYDLDGNIISFKDIIDFLSGNVSLLSLNNKYNNDNFFFGLDAIPLIKKVLIESGGSIKISPSVLSYLEKYFDMYLLDSFSQDDMYDRFAENMSISEFGDFTWFERTDGTSFGLQDNGKVVFKDGTSLNSYIYSNGDKKHIIYSEQDLINGLKDKDLSNKISDTLLSRERVLKCFGNFGYVGSINSTNGEIAELYNSINNIKREKTLIGELSNFFESLGIIKYGQDQAAIEKLLLYKHMFQEMNYRQAKKLANSAKEKGKSIPHIRKITTAEYLNIHNKLIQMGFSDVDATIILNSINDAGACSYATVCNEIFYHFRNSPANFEKIFGYPLYKNINGVYQLNEIDLLLDMFLYCNDVKNGGYLIDNNKINTSYLSTQVDPFGNTLPNVSDYQIYLSNTFGKNNSMINSFLKSKNVSLDYSSQIEFNNMDKSNISESDYLALVQKLNLLINSGATLSMGVYYNSNDDNVIHFESFGNEYESVSTKTWNEGGGHSVMITGVTPFGIIVSSWGKKYMIPKMDLINGAEFIITSSNITETNQQTSNSNTQNSEYFHTPGDLNVNSLENSSYDYMDFDSLIVEKNQSFSTKIRDVFITNFDKISESDKKYIENFRSELLSLDETDPTVYIEKIMEFFSKVKYDGVNTIQSYIENECTKNNLDYITFINRYFNVSCSLVGIDKKVGLTTSEDIKKFKESFFNLAIDFFYINNNVNDESILTVAKDYGLDIRVIDSKGNVIPEVYEKIKGKLNDCETRIVYKYNEALFKNSVLENIVVNKENAKISYDFRNNLRVALQNSMRLNNGLPPTGTVLLNGTFEGAVLNKMIDKKNMLFNCKNILEEYYKKSGTKMDIATYLHENDKIAYEMILEASKRDSNVYNELQEAYKKLIGSAVTSNTIVDICCGLGGV